MGTYLTVSLPILFLAAVIQSSFIPQLRIFGGNPDLVLLLVLSWSLNTDIDEALVWAFVGGILQDLLSAAPTGAATLSMLPTLYLIHLLNRQVFKIGFPLAMLILFIGSVVKESMMALIMSVSGFTFDVVAVINVVLPTVLYNMVVGVVVYVMVRWLQRRTRPDTRSFR
jgi:rod shape-determining protein MreD